MATCPWTHLATGPTRPPPTLCMPRPATERQAETPEPGGFLTMLVTSDDDVEEQKEEEGEEEDQGWRNVQDENSCRAC